MLSFFLNNLYVLFNIKIAFSNFELYAVYLNPDLNIISFFIVLFSMIN